MGTWGYKLYDDDMAQDVRDSYTDMLRRGTSGEDAAEKLVAQYGDLDDDEAPVFWFALADTQWKYGRLTPLVKETALRHLRSGDNLRLWEAESAAQAEKREAVLRELEQRLLSPQPEPKAVKQYRLYQCKWSIGDVFAYRLDGEAVKDSRFFGRYVYFVKVDERDWYPGHRVPVAYVFRRITEELVGLEELRNTEFLPQFYRPEVYVKNPGTKRKYRLTLLSTSARVIPKKLIYLGNLGAVEPIADEDLNAYNLLWKRFESYMVHHLNNWL